MANSFVEYVADGATSTFVIPFAILRRDEIHVLINGTEIALATDYTVDANGASITTVVDPVDTSVVRIERRTVITPDTARPVIFLDGSGINARNLNRILTYLLHAIQEADDNARLRALSEVVNDSTKWDAENKPIKNTGAPIDPNDAARLADLLALQTATGNLPPITPLNNRSMLVALNGVWTILTVPQIIASLGIGTAGLLNVGTGANQVVQLDGTAKLPAVDGSQLTNLPVGGGGPGGLASVKTRTIRFTSGIILNNTSGTWFTDSGGVLGRLDVATAQPLDGSSFMGADVTIDTVNNTFTIVNDGTYEVSVDAEFGNKDTSPSTFMEFRLTNQAGTTIYNSSVNTFAAKPTGGTYSEKLLIHQTVILPAGASMGTYAIKACHFSAGGQVWCIGDGTRVTIRKLA